MKKILFSTGILLMLLIAACDNNIRVDSVTISQHGMIMIVGESQTLTATVIPADAHDSTVHTGAPNMLTEWAAVEDAQEGIVSEYHGMVQNPNRDTLRAIGPSPRTGTCVQAARFSPGFYGPRAWQSAN